MSRASRQDKSISLFPFLDVLVCVMGSLIFLLILISARIRADVISRAVAERRAAETAPESPRDDEPRATESEPEPEPLAVNDPPIDVELAPEVLPPPPVPESVPQPEPPDPDDALRRQIAALAARKAAEEEALARWRGTVAEARKRYDETREKIAALDAKRDTVSARDEKRQEERAKLNEEKERLFAELVALETQVRQAQRPKNDVSSKFTFIPYDGASGTTRRPILIECTAEGIRFIPEDVTVTATDVAGFHEGYNPLLAGAVALARYWRTVDGLKPGNEPVPMPYVLLIVRPNGTVAYYYARRMLSQMKEPFGYELLEEGRELELPAVDPKARHVLRDAIAETISKRDKVLADLEGEALDEPSFGAPRRAFGGSGSEGRGDGLAAGRGEKGDRRLRYRPGMGFEVVEDDDGPVPDDAFERAVQESRAKRLGSSGTGTGATNGVARGGREAGAGGRDGSGSAGPAGTQESGTSRGGDSAASRGAGTGGAPDDGVSPLTIGARGASGPRPRGVGPGAPGSETARPGTSGGTREDTGSGGLGTPEGTERTGRGAGNAATAGPVILPNDPRAGGTSDGPDGAAPQPPALTENGGRTGSGIGPGGSSPGGRTGAAGPRGSADSANGGVLADGPASNGTGTGSGSGPGGSSGKPSRGASEMGGGAFDAPLLRNRSDDGFKPGQRRFGYYSKRATIGFERTLTIRVEGETFHLPSGTTVAPEYGDHTADVADRLLDAIDKEARTWGKPPDSFYWVPKLHFLADAEAAGRVEPLREPLQKAGLNSRVEPLRPDEAVPKPGATRPRSTKPVSPPARLAPSRVVSP